jgi:hypothetical protein
MVVARRALALALVALVFACAGRHHHTKPQPAQDIPLRVTNRNWLDVAIYVLHDGQRTRVGTVTGSSAQEFKLPLWMLGQSHELTLIGEAIGSSDVARTEMLVIQPGQYIDWTLETNLRRSSVGVF